MSHNTVSLNKNRQTFLPGEEIWLFGYGSLIHKIDFPYIQKKPAYIVNWERRFWQGSHDHRGTPQQPGRVLTLVKSANTKCDGMAFQVSHDVFEHLDHREKNGYLRHSIELNFHTGKQKQGIVYIASPDNEAYLGYAPEIEIAAQIQTSHGPSGPNREYVTELASALRSLNFYDAHVFSIEHHLLNFNE
ncbi:gamma-glutamylcyclotransferase [Aliikangiella sp. IMCC44632]